MGRDNNGVRLMWLAVPVLQRELGLAVVTQEIQRPVLACPRQALRGS